MIASDAAQLGTEGSAAPQQVPVGLLTGAAAVSMLAGAGVATLLHRDHPTFALLIAPALAVGLYVFVRAILNADGHPSVRSAAALGAAFFVGFYFLVLAGDTLRPPHSHDAWLRAAFGLLYLAGMLAACLSAAVIAGVAAWHAAGEARKALPPNAFAPALVNLGIGAAGFITWLLLYVLVALAAPSREALPYGLLAATLLAPAVFHGVWAYAYGRVLSRWEVPELPDALVRALADLRTRCGFQFDRVICLDGRYGGGRIAAVTSTLRSNALVVSEALASLFDRDELLAVLAHETAHVVLAHTRRKHVWEAVALVVASGGSFVIIEGLARLLPAAPGPLRAMALGGACALAMGLYRSFVTRRHEREADDYAARAIGAGALLRALERLRAGRRPIETANRYTTHSTWAIRSARLQAMAAREPPR